MHLDIKKAFAKLDRPPSAHNFVRLISENPLNTAKNLVRFASAMPPINYYAAYVVIRDMINLGIPLAQALVAVRNAGSAVGRVHNETLLRAFDSWNNEQSQLTSGSVEFLPQRFRVSREISVPVAPLMVRRVNGRFSPLFLCGWGSLSLSLLQRRLYLTICEDAYLSLEDFRESPAAYAFFPYLKGMFLETEEGHLPLRQPVIWSRNEYPLLSSAELNEAIEIFLEGREMAKKMLFDSISSGQMEPGSSSASGSDEDQMQLL
jgi:hypothetical protein